MVIIGELYFIDRLDNLSRTTLEATIPTRHLDQMLHVDYIL